MKPELQIGPYRLATPYLFAPIAGVSDAPFRKRVLRLGASLAPTELISAEGLARKGARTLAYLDHDPEIERPFYVQLFGAEPERMAEAGRIAREMGARLLDINMGCPVPKVVKGGGGSALMREPERAAAIVREVSRATELPVTVKIRSGWTAATINAVEVAKAVEAAGAAAVAVHARTREQGYSGRADWSVIARVKQAVSIPVIGNGDVIGVAEAERMFAETGCDGVMIGRAAMGNPWLFRELTGGVPPTLEERGAFVRSHLLEHLERFESKRAGVAAFRAQLAQYAKGLPGSAEFRQRVMGLEEPEAVLEALDAYFGGCGCS